MSPLSDKTLVCRDCGKQFTFTTGEQEFYQTRQFSEPTRCQDCRAARKSSRDSGRSFDSDRSYSGGSSYGGGAGRSSSGGGYSGSKGRSDYGGRSSSGSRQMFTVNCADCGVETQVPFEPRAGRPVYCRDCFEKHGGGSARR